MLRRIVGAVALSLALVVVGGVPAHATTAPDPYYLSLGDSLSQGVQPDVSGNNIATDQGYADNLYRAQRATQPGLRLAKVGCSGETTGSMISGGVCPYPRGSQLAEAVAFLQTHRVAFVTIDIGANNIDRCVVNGSPDQRCVSDALSAIESDLPRILTALREAAGAAVPIIGMNYYDPFLAAWLQGPAGEALARQSVQLTTLFNQVLDGGYSAFQIPVADVEGAFHTTDFRSIPFVNLPLNVLIVCAWTWMCAPSPIGPNIHANAVGYGVIATTFASRLS